MFNTNAIPAVAITLWGLGLFSIATWALILIKAVQHIRVARNNKRYAKQFWSASNLQAAAEIKGIDSPLAHVAGTGFHVLQGAHSNSQEHDLEHSWDRHELLERNLRQQVQREKRTLESGLAVLATVGSTAPFVGLFGTVWGIMSAMRDISRIGNASIDVVAGPIGEALIATGIGIAVAVPAVLAYNYYLRRVKSVIADLDDFAHDFLNLAQRASYRVERDIKPGDIRSGDGRFSGGRSEVRHIERVSPVALSKVAL
ncbi:MAG TPA: MotA/TolQ/ExbB proton channel family protein [Steroidobacteraceae bacterium]|jgi:biopolymer transport protein ExbB|nr:MotA/TolQ/ExbB proton channel family protein [Steroidobacteraceae bacterium]